MTTFRSGGEPLSSSSGDVGPKLSDFWRWSSSDLLSNTLRGVLAEFIVATALGLGDKPRVEWAAWDLKMPTGETIEVKSAAYIQSWPQDRHSQVRFGIAQSRQAWNPDTGKTMVPKVPRRFADVYVFCLLNHKDRCTVDPLDVDQWEFYVVSTDRLNTKCGDRRTIGLNQLRDLAEGPALPYARLGEALRGRVSRWPHDPCQSCSRHHVRYRRRDAAPTPSR